MGHKTITISDEAYATLKSLVNDVDVLEMYPEAGGEESLSDKAGTMGGERVSMMMAALLPADFHGRRRRKGESFSNVILRKLAESNADRILSVVMGPDFPDKELAENVRQASEEHRKSFRYFI
jgi:predicted CopG family antitoxin